MKTDMFDTVEEAIAAIAAGQLVVVSDDADRENEGDLIMAASKATPETVNMMIRYGSGIVCVPMLGNQLDRLQLGPMVARNREVQRTDFAVSVDASAGISTGVSAYDRNDQDFGRSRGERGPTRAAWPCVPAAGQAGRSA
jgi:3,4-dihydroxy 2-butanone 4-phosphate synthase/GTP cyclohydrolase II